MNHAKSLIVYGPQGCGKTRSAEAMMKHFGLGRVLELDELAPGERPNAVGDLVLSNLTREQLVELPWIDHDARRVMSFEEAMQHMKPTDTKAWADIDVSEPAVQGSLSQAGNLLVMLCHGASLKAGWWGHTYASVGVPMDIHEIEAGTKFGKALVAQKLCLVHSEISEGMEGHRKGLMDDKLPHRTMLEVELADAVIRIADLAGALNLDLGGAIAEKMSFNAVRPDHKKEARESAGGKSY